MLLAPGAAESSRSTSGSAKVTATNTTAPAGGPGANPASHPRQVSEPNRPVWLREQLHTGRPRWLRAAQLFTDPDTAANVRGGVGAGQVSAADTQYSNASQLGCVTTGRAARGRPGSGAPNADSFATVSARGDAR